jgi:F-type H+-transporting ATPase subunit gamma
MKLVSAAKLNKAQESVGKAREYTTALNGLLSELVGEVSASEFNHPLMNRKDEVKTIKLVVVGGNKGLCGGYNANINRKVTATIKEKQKAYPGVKIDGLLLGRKVAEFYRKSGYAYSSAYETLPEEPNKWPIEDICRELARDYTEGRADEIILIFTRFKSAISMQVLGDTLLPFAAATSAASEGPTGLTLFEPSPAEVFAGLIPRLLASKVRQACLEAKASEYGSRMTAMDSATRNAGDIIKRLGLLYNRLRQSKITLELLDIIGGANAVKG